MKPFLFSLLFILFVFNLKAQETTIPSPNTETAFLNYDFRLQRSGYEQVEAKLIYSYVNQPLKLYFVVDSNYNYMFAAIADSSTGGLKVSCTFDEENTPYFESDITQLIKEYNSKITLALINEKNRTGVITVQLDLVGKTAPKEPSYYILVRKKRVY